MIDVDEPGHAGPYGGEWESQALGLDGQPELGTEVLTRRLERAQVAGGQGRAQRQGHMTPCAPSPDPDEEGCVAEEIGVEGIPNSLGLETEEEKARLIGKTGTSRQPASESRSARPREPRPGAQGHPQAIASTGIRRVLRPTGCRGQEREGNHEADAAPDSLRDHGVSSWSGGRGTRKQSARMFAAGNSRNGAELSRVKRRIWQGRWVRRTRVESNW